VARRRFLRADVFRLNQPSLSVRPIIDLLKALADPQLRQQLCRRDGPAMRNFEMRFPRGSNPMSRTPPRNWRR
jgi:hypothetical protein